MTDDQRATGRSDAEVRQLAKKLRSYFGIDDAVRIDVLACSKHDSIWTVNGVKRLVFQVRPDHQLGSTDGLTIHNGDSVTIVIKRSVHEAAQVGEGRARNTFAHEFGHAVMHNGVAMPRLATGNVTPAWIKPFESAEHQVKVFAPAFLINDKIAERLDSPEEISIEFGISYESARIYFGELTAPKNRSQTSKQMLQLAEELRGEKNLPRLHFLNDPCPVCGKQTLFPVDAKFMCQHCDRVFDRFQDGDH